MEVGLQIKLLRESKRLSRETMADVLGMSINTYAKIETGDRFPDLRELQVISDTLEVDPVIFLRKDGNSVVTHGDNSPGYYGNVIHNDPALIKSLSDAVENLRRALEEIRPK